MKMSRIFGYVIVSSFFIFSQIETFSLKDIKKTVSKKATQGKDLVTSGAKSVTDTAAKYNPVALGWSTAKELAEKLLQMGSAKLVLKDSVLIKENPYKNQQAHVRVGAQLNASERQYVARRKPVVKDALERFLGQELTDQGVPIIATVNSGGGVRALVSMLGFHIGAENTGLLPTVMYDVGLSGGAWFVSLWTQSKKSLQSFKNELRPLLQLGLTAPSNDLSKLPRLGFRSSKNEKELIAESFIVRAGLEQPFTKVNIWGALIANRYLKPYGNNRHAVRFSQSISNSDATRHPFPILTAVNASGYDATEAHRANMDWYEFTPYEVGGVGPWLRNAYVPTWAFGRKFKNKISQNNNPEYDLGLLMGIWGSAFGITFARIYEEIRGDLGVLKKPVNLILSGLGTASEVIFKHQHISVGYAHNFTRDIAESPYKKETKLKMIDGGIAFNLPYPPVSGHGSRKADVIIFFDASGGIYQTGAVDLLLAEKYARVHNLKFPKLPTGQKFTDMTNKKTVAIFKDETDPSVPLVIYFPALVHRDIIKYDASIPADFHANLSTMDFYYDAQRFNNLSLVTQQNVEQTIDQVKEAIRWKVGQKNGFKAPKAIE